MELVAKTLYGLEKVLADELESLGAENVRQANRAVLFSGDKALLYRVNYCSRTALSFLVSVKDFRIRSKEDLYSKASVIDWSVIMDERSSFSVMPVVNSKYFDHTGYPALVVKDAIADFFRKKSGKRPSVNTTDPDVLINLHISSDQVNISVDSTVVPLYKRGYRAEQGSAPLNEVLAAGIIMLSGWDAATPLIDPMCGSGTIAVEAGLIACNIPPGKFRKFFGFTRWKNFDSELFDTIKNESDSKIIKCPVGISASDISGKAFSETEANIKSSGLSDAIKVYVSDIKDINMPDHKGFVFINPPYGQRLAPEDLDKLYGTIGTTLKHSFQGSRVWIITAAKEYVRHIGLKPKSKRVLFNGALESLLLEYEMYEGSRKQHGGPKS